MITPKTPKTAGFLHMRHINSGLCKRLKLFREIMQVHILQYPKFCCPHFFHVDGRQGALGEDIANFFRVLANRKFSRYRRNQAIDFLRGCQEYVLRKWSARGQKGTATDVALTLTSNFTSGSASGILPNDKGLCGHRSFCS